MLTDIRALADHFLIALPNINTPHASSHRGEGRMHATILTCILYQNPSSSPCRGVTSFHDFQVLATWALSLQIGVLTDLDHDRNIRSHCTILCNWPITQKHIESSWGFCLFLVWQCCCNLSILTTYVHRSLREQVSDTLVLGIQYWERMNKVFRKLYLCDCSYLPRHDVQK